MSIRYHENRNRLGFSVRQRTDENKATDGHNRDLSIFITPPLPTQYYFYTRYS